MDLIGHVKSPSMGLLLTLRINLDYKTHFLLSNNTSSIISVSKLHWRVGKGSIKSILEDINLDIGAGQVTAVVGPNGAGKTSLLRCLLGLVSDYSGTITLAQKDVKHLSRQVLAKQVAYVPQTTDSLFDLSVYDVVQMGMLPHVQVFQLDAKREESQICAALEKVGMENAKAQKINTLSGGELQRVLIARALVQKAEVLILDEPTNHLDVYFQHQILGLLRALDMTVLLTIHDLNLAAQYCDQIVLLDKGKLIQHGTPQKVFQEQVLTNVFGLPCSVALAGEQRIPSICFHPVSSTGEN